MRTLGYIAAITMAAAGAVLGVLVVKSLPDLRRYEAIRKMLREGYVLRPCPSGFGQRAPGLGRLAFPAYGRNASREKCVFRVRTPPWLLQ